MYLYLAEKDNFDCLPDKLNKNLGTAQFAMQLELHKDRTLAKEDITQVIENLQQKGFHLQMPDDTPVSEIMQKIAQNEQKNTHQ
jgi:hypothetical protein